MLRGFDKGLTFTHYFNLKQVFIHLSLQMFLLTFYDT